MLKMSGPPGGLISEQVWDQEPIVEYGLYPDKPTASAMPLPWAHAEIVKTAMASIAKLPIELLAAVKRRYNFERPTAATWH